MGGSLSRTSRREEDRNIQKRKRRDVMQKKWWINIKLAYLCKSIRAYRKSLYKISEWED